MKVLVDMNLSPAWVPALAAAGHQARHWSTVGPMTARDQEIMAWASENGFVVLTHDLDFGAILAATAACAPSVIQVRADDHMPRHMAALVVSVMLQHADALQQGALISIDDERARLRLLPMRRK